MIVSCKVSSKFHRRSSQNQRFARCFRQFSQKKLPKRSFRARLLPNFTEQAAKKIVSREASSKFHRRSSQNQRFVRGFFQISQNKLPKRTFRARLPPIFTEQASKTNVSRDASDNFHRNSFQNDRFVRGFFEVSQNKLPKRAFRTRLPTIFTEKTSKTIVSCDAPSKFHRTSCQKDRFVRGFFEISQKKLAKSTFRARLLRNFTEEARKINVSCKASSNFHRTSFQNERFARCFRQFSQKQLPKRSFRSRLLRSFTEQASKTSVSHKASDNFHRKNFQNDRFVRCFLEISQNKLPKRSFRTRLPRNFTEEAHKINVSCEASSKFHRRSFQNDRFVQGFLEISQKKLAKSYFFCWRLLGLIPGGAPFSQLSSGVKDAMVVSTEVNCHL